jgi:hypothetical protein
MLSDEIIELTVNVEKLPLVAFNEEIVAVEAVTVDPRSDEKF